MVIDKVSLDSFISNAVKLQDAFKEGNTKYWGGGKYSVTEVKEVIRSARKDLQRLSAGLDKYAGKCMED